MNKFELREALRRQPGIHQARDLMRQHQVKATKLYGVLGEMERAGEVLRWGSYNATRWQILERERRVRPVALWEKLGWPDPMTWPETVPLGYTGG